MDNIAIKVENLCKKYSIYKKTKEKYLDFFLKKSFGIQFNALNNISFTLEKGQSLGLLGLNGSGKTTLANILAGASSQTSGNLVTNGSVSMISVSSGITTALTGRENIVQKCLLLGISPNKINEIMPEIIEFSELSDFIDQQVKTYSSGMRSKLGFAISININPDILIIDEALSVGDPTFTDKCLKKMYEFRQNEKTVVFVSHSIAQVQKFCDRALWLEGGKMVMFDDCDKVTKSYNEFISKFNRLSNEEKSIYKKEIYKKQVSNVN